MSLAAEPAGPDATQRRATLKEGRYAELNHDMTAVQQAYEHGSISDEQLFEAFRAFYFADPDLEPKLDQWVARFPRSYVALLARGIYYDAMGWVKRGGKYARDTREEQFAGMQAYHRMAIRDLSKSIELDPKPTLSYVEEIEIGKAEGMKKENRELLDQAIKKDPRNIVVRRTYLYSIRTRWGGSAEQMAAFVDECQRSDLPATTLREFEALVIADRAWVMMRNGDYPSAEKAYAQALAMMPDDRDTLTQMSDVLIHEHKYEQAVAPLSRLINIDPHNIYALSNRGAIYQRMKQPERAVKDYAKAAELGDEFSENELGKFYWHGIAVPRDRERAIKLFRSAAEKGNKNAGSNLAWALKG
jgi:tetratricopeptide (TPR) repeat protein